MENEERIEKLEKEVLALKSLLDPTMVKKTIFNKRSSVDPTSLSADTDTSALVLPDELQEVVIDGQRKLIPTYNG